jgi:DNA gyrase subunit A
MVFTKEQYLKKTLRYADADKQKVKDGDIVLGIQQTSNRGEVILLSNLGNAYKIQINDLQEKQPSAMGEYLPSLLSLESNEQILGMLSTSDFKGHAIIVYENGKIAKVCLDSYATKTKRTKLQNSLNLESPVVAIFQVDEDIDLLIKSNQNKAIIVNTKDVSEKSSRNTQGITFMKSNKEDFKVTEAKIYDGSLDTDYYRTDKACSGKSLF